MSSPVGPRRSRRENAIALLTGGTDKPYAVGLALSLLSRGLHLDFIGSDELDCPELRSSPNLRFLNLRGDQREDAALPRKVQRILSYYARLIRYASLAEPTVFHILWNNRFQTLDRTVLMLYYKLQGKKIVLTAHNVNAGERDSQDSLLNRLTLKAQYRLADHIFVHTERLKAQLVEAFRVRRDAITVIPFGLTAAVPDTRLTRQEARRRLGLAGPEKTILFFGRIGPYKGLEFLIAAFQQVAAAHPEYRLVIAGKPHRGCERYLVDIQRAIGRDASGERVIQRIEYIPDEDTEAYFKAADVLVLPYTDVSQSGVLVLGYRFGLPVIAADVGSLREDIVEGRTGFLCRPGDAVDLARAIEAYFQSELFQALDSRRDDIRRYARDRYSWDAIGEVSQQLYSSLGRETRQH